MGVACSGGTIANVTAMWTARNNALGPRNSFQGVEKEGLRRGLLEYGYKDACIVGSRLLHYSFKKAADLLGFGEEGLVLVDTDSKYRIKYFYLTTSTSNSMVVCSVEELKKTVQKLQKDNILVIAIVAIVGTTETGSIDPIDAMYRVSSHHQIHLHVDAAWGGPLIYSRDHSHKLHGIHLATSITVDGHKQLYTPMGN